MTTTNPNTSVIETETQLAKKRPLEIEDISEDDSKDVLVFECGNDFDDNPPVKIFLYRQIKYHYAQFVFSKSELVKTIKNPYFLEKLICFIKIYHESNGFFRKRHRPPRIYKTSPEFLELVSHFRMAYYLNKNTDDELWYEFTSIYGEIKYHYK